MSPRAQSFLLQSFTEFYRLAAGIKTKIIALESLPPDESVGPGFERLDPKTITDRLLLVLDRQQTQLASSQKSAGAKLYQEARYCMVALADEVFLDLEWSGKVEWSCSLLEEKVFHSQSSGDQFFRKLDQLLLEPGPGQVDLAKVYLMALALGFKGKYITGDPDGQLAAYRVRLYNIIFKRDPELFEKQAKAFPQNYANVLGQGDAKWLPTTKRWQLILAAILFGGVLITHIAWSLLTGPLNKVINEILATGV